jgi:hypothetical protein
MIHFDFIVSDEDASTIMSAVHHEIIACYDGMVNDVGTGTRLDPAKKVWYEGRIKYLEGLKAKMTNSRIG